MTGICGVAPMGRHADRQETAIHGGTRGATCYAGLRAEARGSWAPARGAARSAALTGGLPSQGPIWVSVQAARQGRLGALKPRAGQRRAEQELR